jgi:HSP20 family molecular chaperone IbpA
MFRIDYKIFLSVDYDLFKSITRFFHWKLFEKHNNKMVFGLEKIFKGNTKKESMSFSNLDEHFIPDSREEDVHFEITNMGDHHEILCEVDGVSARNIDVQFNYYHIFVKGEAIIEGHVENFSRQFPMPKGAIKKNIQAIVTREGKLKIIVPIELKYRDTKNMKERISRPNMRGEYM